MTDNKEQRYERTFTVGQRAELTLRNVRGDIQISGWDRPEVSIVAVKTMGSEWGAHESFDRTTVETDQDGSHIRVRTRAHTNDGLFGWMGIGRTPPRVSYTIKTPATSDVSLRTVNGNLRISGIIGAAYLRTVDGDIEIERLSGQIIVSSVSAAIRGNEIGGTVAIKAISGNVVFTRSQLTSFYAKSVSGDVELETTIDPAGSYEAGSVSGSFRLLVPPDSQASAELTSVSGRGSCELPCRVTEQDRRHWQATINNGGALIRLKSVDGSLTIAPTTRLTNAPAPTPPAAPAAAPADNEWPEMDILKSVERGEVSVEDAIARLAELDKK